MPRGWGLAACGLLFVSTIAESVVSSAIVLTPRVPLRKQMLPLGGAGAVYELSQLRPLQEYEVRLSYPATIPATVTFQWEPSTVRHRKLLDLEKVQFRADGQGRSPGRLRITAGKAGFHRDGPSAGAKTLLYNIELAPVYFGVPSIAMPVVLYIIAGCIVRLHF